MYVCVCDRATNTARGTGHLDVEVHVPVYEGGEWVNEHGTRILAVVQHVVLQGGMLEHAHQYKVPGAQGVGQEDKHGG